MQDKLKTWEESKTCEDMSQFQKIGAHTAWQVIPTVKFVIGAHTAIVA